jgi:DNA-binding transcriptional MerR regulator
VARVTHELMTLEELTQRVGISVRNVRFYTTKGLVPPPIRRGRCGYYTPDHVARLELVQELQAHGFTLAAIERYVAGIPADASPEDVALHRTMLAPWMPESPVAMTVGELEARCSREMTEDDLATLAALGVVRLVEGEEHLPRAQRRVRVAVSQLGVALALHELGFPREAAQAAADVYAAHGRAIAEELYTLFRDQVWPRYKGDADSADRLQEVVERLKPLSVASLVNAYESAMEERRRTAVARRRRPAPEAM